VSLDKNTEGMVRIFDGDAVVPHAPFLVLGLIMQYGWFDEVEHKQWLLDQILRAILTPDAYQEYIKIYCAGQDGPNTYTWSEGVAQ
jgi:hypothetical protein